MLWIVVAIGAVALVVAAVHRAGAPDRVPLGWWLRGAALLLLLLATMRLGLRALPMVGPLGLWLLWTLFKPAQRTRFQDPSGDNAVGPMSRDEALRVLDLEEGASPLQIQGAYRRLIKKLHPDQGGSSFLTQQVEEARRVLLRR